MIIEFNSRALYVFDEAPIAYFYGRWLWEGDRNILIPGLKLRLDANENNTI